MSLGEIVDFAVCAKVSLKATVGVMRQEGRPFHSPCGIRVNLALPTERAKEAMRRLKEYVFTVEKIGITEFVAVDLNE